MTRTPYQRGADKERRIMKNLSKEGYLCLRSAGSHSIFDVVAINPVMKIIKLIQSKLGDLPRSVAKQIIEEGQTFEGDYEVKFQLWN